MDNGKTIPLDVKMGMVEEFQCPGCTMGADTSCGSFQMKDLSDGSFRCGNHSAGTIAGGLGFINLGLPTGFNVVRKPRGDNTYTNVRLHGDASTYKPDRLNVPVWAMEKDGYLFVRTFSPRVDAAAVDVIKGGTLADAPGAVNVGEFADQIG